MKLPISFLLYVSSLGLAGFTGWQVYELLPLRKQEAKHARHEVGRGKALDKLTLGKSEGPVSADWYYTGAVSGAVRTGNRWWWKQLQQTNFIGKPPPPPTAERGETSEEPVVVAPPATPLEDIFELGALVYDYRDDGRGKLSHVVVQYKPDAGVEAPAWYVRERQNSLTPGGGGPGDRVAPPPRSGGNQNFRGGNRNKRGANPVSSAIPVAQGTGGPNVLIQEIWVQGTDKRSSPKLWGKYEHIRLVRVSPDAQSAYFVRQVPSAEDPAKMVDGEEEQLFKGAANMSQEVLRALAALDGRDPDSVAATGNQPGRSEQNWVDEADTRMVETNRWNIGRKDHESFQADDDFLEKVYFDTYKSRYSNLRGVIVRNIDPKLAARFGIAEQDVLIEVNNHPVKTQAEALQFGKKEHKKGVRTFVTKWQSGGEEVIRTYQLPEK